MKTLRNLAIAATIALGTALSAGAASAAPAAGLALDVPAATESNVAPAYHFGGYGSLCYMPFYRLVQFYGYWQARMIKRRCFFRPWGGYPY